MPSFNVEYALNYIKELAIPRRVGTPGEEQAAQYIFNTFERHGLEPRMERFEFSDPVFLLNKILTPLTIVVTFLAAYVLPRLPLLSVMLSIMVMACGMYVSRNMAAFAYALRNVGKTGTYHNVIAASEPTEATAKGHVIVGAHYDSISARRRLFSGYGSYVLGIVALLGIVLFSIFIITVSILTLVGVEVAFADPVKLIWSSIIVVVFLPSVITGEGNESSGAVDNASGVAVVLELARVFAQEKPQHLRLSFIAFAAEEKMLLGSVSYLRRHRIELDSSNTYVIVFDSPAFRGSFGYNKNFGFPPRETAPYLNKLIRESAATLGIEVRAIGLAGTAGDHVPFVESGFHATGIGTMSKDLLNVIHTKNDTLESVDIRNLEAAGIIGQELIHRIDRDLREVSCG